MNLFLTILIPTLTSLAALITAIAALRSIKEMRRQRKSSMLPELLFPKSHFYTYWCNPREGVPLFWSKKQIEEPDYDVSSYSANRSYFNVEFDCYNVGFGVAKEVEIKWEFDLMKFIQVVDELDKNNLFRISSQEDDYINIYSEKFNYLSVLRSNDFKSRNIKFILPASILNQSNLVSIPKEYIELYTIYIYLNIEGELDEESSEELKLMPSLNVTVSYTDIENEVYTSKFIATPSFSALWGIVEDKNWSKAGRIEFNFQRNA